MASRKEIFDKVMDSGLFESNGNVICARFVPVPNTERAE